MDEWKKPEENTRLEELADMLEISIVPFSSFWRMNRVFERRKREGKPEPTNLEKRQIYTKIIPFETYKVFAYGTIAYYIYEGLQ